MKEQLQLHKEKIDQARAYMRERGIDLWLIRDRGTGDPSVPLLFGTRTVGDTIFLIRFESLTALVPQEERLAVEEAELFDEVVAYADDGLAAALSSRLREWDPRVHRAQHLTQ